MYLEKVRNRRRWTIFFSCWILISSFK